MRRKVVYLCLVVFVFSFMIQEAYADTYNSASAFSSSNPSGLWSYRYADINALNSSSSLLPAYNTSKFWHWDSIEGSIIGQELVHTGVHTDTILAFDLSEALPWHVTLNVSVWDGATYGNGQIFSIWKNDTELFRHELESSFGIHDFEQHITIDPADKVYLRYSNNGDNSYDTMYTNATVTQVAVAPEPVSSILFLTGGAALCLSRLRKKRNI